MVATNEPLETCMIKSAWKWKICASERFVSDAVYELTSTYIGKMRNFETCSTIVASRISKLV
jgi:hypothetical protein